MDKIVKCPCGNYTNQVFTDYKTETETYSFCYFCADMSDCWDGEFIPPEIAFKMNGKR